MSPKRPQSAAAGPSNELRLQLDRLLDRVEALEIRRAKPENRRMAQQSILDEEKADLEEKISKVRERLQRIARRSNPGGASSPAKTMGPPPPLNETTVKERPDRTLTMLVESKSTTRSPSKVNGRAIQSANRMYYEGMKKKRQRDEKVRSRLQNRGLSEDQISGLLRTGGPAMPCTEGGMSLR